MTETRTRKSDSLRRLLKSGVIAGLLLVLASGTQPVWSQTPDLELQVQEADTLALAVPGHVAGLAWLGTGTLALLTDIPDSLAAGGRRQVRLIFQDRKGRPLLDEDFTGVLDRGLAFDGEYLWSCGDAAEGTSLLYKIKVDTLRVEEAYDLPGHRPTGLTFDGNFLWLADRDSGRLDRFDPKTEAVTRTVVAPGFSPFGVAWDGRHMWVSDSGTGRLYRLTGSRRNWSATVSTRSFSHRSEDILLANDGSSLWYVPEQKQFAIRVIFP